MNDTKYQQDLGAEPLRTVLFLSSIIKTLEATKTPSYKLWAAYMQLGRTLRELGNCEQALEAIRNAQAHLSLLESGVQSTVASVDQGKVHYELAEVLLRLQRFPEAETECQRAKTIFLQMREALDRYISHVDQQLLEASAEHPEK